jgi:hypothetical protein
MKLVPTDICRGTGLESEIRVQFGHFNIQVYDDAMSSGYLKYNSMPSGKQN